MRRATTLLSSLLCVGLTACASGSAGEVAAVQAPLGPCSDVPVLRAGDVTAVQPLWAPSPLLKSPSYQLAGVILELGPGLGHTRDELQAALRCPTACTSGRPDLLALPGLEASIDDTPGHLAVVLRSDDPGTAREAMHRAERLLPRR